MEGAGVVWTGRRGGIMSSGGEVEVKEGHISHLQEYKPR